MTFQRELLSLFESFSVQDVGDFDRLPPKDKTYFVARLYKCFQRGLKQLPREIGGSRGLKLHYQRDQGKRLEDTFYKKLALYTSRFVVSCPIKEAASSVKPAKSKRMTGWERLDSAATRELRRKNLYVFGHVRAHARTHGGEIHIRGRYYIVNRNEILELIRTVLGLREAMRNDLVHVLPGLPDKQREFNSALRKGQVFRGNFRRDELVRQFAERDLQSGESVVEAGLTSIYLPYLTNIPFEQILEVRDDLSQEYEEFQIALSNFVIDSTARFSETQLEQYLKRTDEAIRAIRARQAELRRKWSRKNREILMKYVCFSLVCLVNPHLLAPLLPFLGSVSASDYFTSNREFKDELEAASSGEFYLPWKISDSR